MNDQTTDMFELSPQQEQLWLSQPDGPAGRVQAHLTLTGALDVSRVEAGLARSVARHEILRTTFVHRPGIRVPMQAVAAELAPAFSTIDLSELGPSDQRSRLDEASAQELVATLDFAQGPLVRALLADLGGERHALLLTVSSLCADASSLTLLARELVADYGDVGGLLDDPLQYADFAAWQRELQDSDDAEAVAGREFWKRAAETATPAIPFTSSVSVEQVPARIELELEGEVAGRLSDAGRRYGAGVESVAHAAWLAVLGASAGEREVGSALVRSDRRHDDLQGAVGAFSRSVPFFADVAPEVTFGELLAAVSHASDEAAVWQDYAPHDATMPAMAFVAAEAFDGTAGGLRVTLDAIRLGGSGFGVWLTCFAGENQLALSVDYDPSYLSTDSARLLAERTERLLHSIAADPGAALGELELLGADERRLLVSDWGDGGPGAAAGAVHVRFAGHAAAAPARTAVIDEHGSISYGDLDRRANQLAARLRREGVGPDVAVGLCTDRSIEMVVGLLGILKAGGAYLPLHYEHPPARLAQQLETAGAGLVVTQEALLGHLPPLATPPICLDRDRATLDAEDDTDPGPIADDQNLAYVIYTSGSTGTPKGVGVTHGNVANYAGYIVGRLEAESEPLAFGMVTSISTDLGNTSVFGALCSGGTLVLISPVAAADAGAMAAQLDRSPVDVIKITPSHAAALIAGGDARVLPRRWLVIGGERAPWDLVARVHAMSDCQILNHYGPTEATIGCCTQPAPEAPGAYQPATVPIGAPISGDRCRVLDERRRLVPAGAPGRLFVGGAGVARGYVGAPELTAERFFEDPFAGEPAARMYDTGDLVRWLPDGSLEFLGRVDEQVKIRGYRVEPAEVEAALRAGDRVADAVVVARPSPAGDVRLIAYCTGDGIDQMALRSELADRLPEFMIPSAIVTLESLPMTPSGKVDRLALPDPEEAVDAGAEYQPPRTPVEQAMVEIWSHVLGIERIGIDDDFFALGGHSLLATQVVAQVRSDFAVDLPLHSLFSFPTVASLSAEIVSMMGESDEEETSRLMAELEGLSDEEAERLLAGELRQPEE